MLFLKTKSKCITWLGQTCNNGSEHVGLLNDGLDCNWFMFGYLVDLVGLSRPIESSDDVAFGDRQNFFNLISHLFSGFWNLPPPPILR